MRRSELRRGDPAEDFGSRDVNALGRDDEDGVLFDVSERVDLVAFVDAEGSVPTSPSSSSAAAPSA